MNQAVVCSVLLFFISGALGGEPVQLGKFSGQRPLIESWKLMTGDSPAFAQPTHPDQTWPRWQPGTKIPLGPLGGYFWLRTKIQISSDLQGSPLYFSFGKLDAPAEFYFNGVLLQTRGSFPPEYGVTSALSFQVPLPGTLIRWDDENTIAVRLHYTGHTVPMPVPGILDEQTHRFETGVSDLFNSTFFFFSAAINFFAGIFFLIQFFYRRNFPANLYFALSSIFMGFYFLEMGATVPFLPAVMFKVFAKASLSLSIGFLLVFFVEYFKFHSQHLVRAVILGIFSLTALVVLFSQNESELAERFRLALLPVQVGILGVAYMVIRATFQGNRDAIPILVGTIIGVGCGTYDTIHFALGIIPFAWLQGLGFFSVEMSMFLSLAIRSSRLYYQLEKSTLDLESKKQELTATNQALSRFVPQEFLSFLGKKSIMEIQLGDKVQKEMTVLFSDIRSFTTLSENLTPDENFKLLNSYLSRMAPLIRESGGLIDKYIGDAIMALFPRSAENAILASLKMREALKEHNEGRSRAGYPPLEIGIGLHTGSLMMGTIGETLRMDSTVISDVVNVASRLESLTKVFGVPILASGDIVNLKTGLDYLTPRYMGTVQVRGKSQKIQVYEILSQADPLFPQKYATKEAFETAVRVFETGDLKGARKKFQDLGTSELQDPGVLRYLDTIQRGYLTVTWEM